MFAGFLSTSKKLLQWCGFFLLGILVTVLYYHSLDVTQQNCIQKYRLTSQLLDCATYEDSSARLQAVDTMLNDKATLYIKEGKATRVSVWVRDLESKQWAAANENERYAPASLLKLPLMIAYYKLAEIDPAILDTKLLYASSTLTSSTFNNSVQDFAPAHPLVPGQSYTVEELIENMIINSDNGATSLLASNINQTVLTNTMVDLGIQIPGNMMRTYDFVTAKSYATIFRTLHSASYLNRDNSEKALELMSSSTFQGIKAALPAGVRVADKFGEREVDNPDGTVQKRELHDCGIVYKGERPFSLCIMTEGADFNQLLSIIKDISKTVYDQM